MDHYMRGIPVRSDLNPGQIAARRCADMMQADQMPYLAQFHQTFEAARAGIDTYHRWHAIQGDSILMAGYLEGIAAARRGDL
jgi:hypothetical protein